MARGVPANAIILDGKGYRTISSVINANKVPGLRGFSETSIKRMRIFYEAWCCMFKNRPLSADDLQFAENISHTMTILVLVLKLLTYNLLTFDI